MAPGGPVASVSAAVRLARPGDTIVVTAGVYREPRIELTRPVVLLGERGAVLDGGGSHEVVTVRADGVTVRGLTIRHVGTSFTEDRAAIRLDGVRGCVIADNVLLDAFFGVYASRSSDCVVSGNRIEGRAERQTSSGNAIHLFASADFTVAHNRVRGPPGRDLPRVLAPRGDPRQREPGQRPLRPPLHVLRQLRVPGQRLRPQRSGVAVMYSRAVQVLDNRFEDNWGSAAYGLLLKEIKDSRIEGNLFARNTVGLFAEGMDRVTVERNQFLRNGWALRLMADATDNRFRHNRFEGNSFDVATNSQASSPSSFAENYWDGYAGLRSRPRRLRRRAVPSGAALLGAGRAERADADPAAELLPGPAGGRRAASCRCSRRRRWWTRGR